MVAIQAAIVTISPLLRDIIKAISGGDARITMVAEFATRDQLAENLRALRPDLVLIGLEPGESDRIAALVLTASPCSRVIAFSSDGRDAYLHELRPRRRAAPNVSAKAVIRMINAPRWGAKV